jgi:hypothetical protein
MRRRPAAARRTRPGIPGVARWGRLALAALMVAGLVVAGAEVGASPAGAAPAAATPTVTLLGQSTWVDNDEAFDLRLGLARGLSPTDHIEVTAYPRLVTRTSFDQAAAGDLGQASPVWIGQESVGGAPHAHRGGVWARIPVDTSLSPDDLETSLPFDPGDQSGVYPVRIQVLGPDYVAVGATVSTFLVYDAGGTGAPRLSTAVTVGVGATPALSSGLLPTAPVAAVSKSLSQLVAALDVTPAVPITLAVSPETAQALARGTATDRTTLGRLRALVHGGDQLLAEPYAPVSLASLDASGLDDQIGNQLREGAGVLSALFGAAPSMRTWVIDDRIDDATLQILRTAGLRDLVVPDDAMSPLPASDQTTTYGRPTALYDGTDSSTRVMGSDPILDARAASGRTPVLAAQQTLAELAMIQLELPYDARGVAISVPAGSTVSPTYLTTLLAGLRGNPFVRAITTTGLFDRVTARPPQGPQDTTAAAVSSTSVSSTSASSTSASSTSASSTSVSSTSASPSTGSASTASSSTASSSTGSSATGISSAPGATSVVPIPVRRLRPVDLPPLPGTATLLGLDNEITGLAGFLPSDTGLISDLRRQYLIAPSFGLIPALRQALLDSMVKAIGTAESSVRLPGDISVTLTSLKATLPLVVMSDPHLLPHVQIVLASPKLGFRPFHPQDGTCTVTGRTSETCDLVLRQSDTVLRVPVEARTSGVFSLDVTVTSPDGSLRLASERDTVRSTAVSFVGIVIIIASLLFLGIWWIRDIRSGRRPRELVRRPGDDIDDDGDGGGPSGDDLGPGPPPVGPVDGLVPDRAPRPAVTVPAVPVGAGRHGGPGLHRVGGPGLHRVGGPGLHPVGGPGLHRHGGPGLHPVVDLSGHRRDDPVGRRTMSPSHGRVGLIHRADTDPLEELAP